MLSTNGRALMLATSLLTYGELANVSLAETKTVKLTVSIRGTIKPADANALQKTLSKLAGAKVKPDAVKVGEKGQFGHYFSPPFVIELQDTNKLDIGAVATAISETKTPSRSEVPPSLNLTLYSVGKINEASVMELREVLGKVNGLEPYVSGGLGAWIKSRRYWVRLEATGGAQIEFIQQALKAAQIDLKLIKPEQD